MVSRCRDRDPGGPPEDSERSRSWIPTVATLTSRKEIPSPPLVDWLVSADSLTRDLHREKEPDRPGGLVFLQHPYARPTRYRTILELILPSVFSTRFNYILDGKLVLMVQTFEAKSPLGHLLVEHRERVLAIAHEHRAANVQVFGSVARGDDTPESDIDFLVEFLPPLNLLTRIGLIDDLEIELGVSVDVSTPTGLKKRCRSEILAESRVL